MKATKFKFKVVTKICNVCETEKTADVITGTGECRQCFSDRITTALNDGTNGNPKVVARLKKEDKL